MFSLLSALVLTAAVPATAAAPSPVDMRAWETEVLGAIYGTYCGYYPDRLTSHGQALHLKSFAECKRDFDEAAKKCVAEVKAKYTYEIADTAEGTRLGQALGTCIDGVMADKAQARVKKAAPPTGKK